MITTNKNIKIEVLESTKWEHLPAVNLTPKEIYNIETSENIETLRLDNLVIDGGRRKKTSLTKICYKHYKHNQKGNTYTHDIFIQKGSLIKERLNVAKSIVELVAIWHAKNLSNATIYLKLVDIVKFINSNFFVPFPTDLESARYCLKPYIAALHEKIKIYIPEDKDKGQARVGINTNTANQGQNYTIEFLCHHLKLNKIELIQGIKLVKRAGKNKKSTQALYQDELAQEFNYYTIMFRQLSRIILNNEMLPKKIVFSQSEHWILPTKCFLKIDTKSFFKIDTKQKRLNVPYWNHVDGTNYTRHYVEECRGKKMWDSEWYRRTENMKDYFINNNLEWSSTRAHIAQTALKAYYMQFTILTGMNDSVIATLPFNAEFETEKDAQNFTAIKYRANGKEVRFSIQSEFISDFLLFVKLRKYILEKQGEFSFKSLFFLFLNEKGSEGIIELDKYGRAGVEARKALSIKAPFKLSANRELRVTKGLWVRKSFGMAVSAYVLQHSPSTSMKNYSGNSKVETSKEFTDYFEWLNKKVLNHDFSVETETGGCASQYEPEFAEGTPDEFQKCGKGEGCLFCSSYRLHADENDLRKLFSLKFLVSECITVAANNEHFEKMYRPLINRIESLVSELIKQEPELHPIVISVEKSVFEDEELTPFWLRKYETLIDMGIL